MKDPFYHEYDDGSVMDWKGAIVTMVAGYTIGVGGYLLWDGRREIKDNVKKKFKKIIHKS